MQVTSRSHHDGPLSLALMTGTGTFIALPFSLVGLGTDLCLVVSYYHMSRFVN